MLLLEGRYKGVVLVIPDCPRPLALLGDSWDISGWQERVVVMPLIVPAAIIG
jgi:hypothetical protein